MENGIAFVEPTRLGVDEVLQGAARKRRGTLGDGLLVEMIDGTGAVGIEEGALGGDVHGRADGGNAELYDVLGGECGMDFDEAVVGSKTRVLHPQLVAGKGKVPGGELASIVCAEEAVELDGVTGEFDRGFDRTAIRAGDFEAQLASVALRQKRKSDEEDAEMEPRTHELEWRNFYAISFEICDCVTKEMTFREQEKKR